MERFAHITVTGGGRKEQKGRAFVHQYRVVLDLFSDFGTACSWQVDVAQDQKGASLGAFEVVDSRKAIGKKHQFVGAVRFLEGGCQKLLVVGVILDNEDRAVLVHKPGDVFFNRPVAHQYRAYNAALTGH